MNILLVHQNFPGQFKHLCQTLGPDPRHRLVFVTQHANERIPGVRTVLYSPARQATAGIHHYVRELEQGVLHGQAVLRVAKVLRDEGFVPDVIVGHNGWGEILFLKDLFPKVPLLGYFEFFYRGDGADVGFDPEYPSPLDDFLRVRMKNAINWAGLGAVDWGLSPTDWQRSGYPPEFRERISVIHEGIDTALHRPDPDARLVLPDGRVVKAGDEVVTFVSRSLEPYRGFHIFMRAIPKILERRPDATILVLGGDDVSYGRPAPQGMTYRQQLTAEVTIDPERVVFMGRIPYEQFAKVLQVSAAHVYLSYPFVLSWSMLEAMSAGCLVIGSATPPVQEVIRDGVNGLLVDFFSSDQIAERVQEALSAPERMRPLREAARRAILDRYGKEQCLAELVTLIETLTAGRIPSD